MPRNIPIELQRCLDSRATSLAQLLRIETKLGDVIGLTNTNDDITYGGVTYTSLSGFEDSAYQASSGKEIDNAEAKIIFPPVGVLGITPEQARSGYLDGARFRVLLVDYNNLAAGHAVLEWGFVGMVRLRDSEASVIELRGAQQMARQKAVCERGSKTCRATFGDATTGCGFDLIATGVVGTGTVSAVGVEADRVFTSDADLPKPGLVTFTTGNNAGLSFEVEVAGFEAELVFPTPYPIQIGDEFTWREDCDKKLETCKDKGQLLNFRGEPHRPEAIGSALQFPGAATS